MTTLRHRVGWLLRSSPLTRGLVYAPLRWVYDRTINASALARDKAMWEARHTDVKRCADNAFLPRVPDAGKIVDGVQIMHNGVKVAVGSYYGSQVTRMLQENKGVHEPQEERVFAEVMQHLHAQPVMIELGAYWGFYSLWFLQSHPQGRAILVEPEAENITMGEKNFVLNARKGEFVRAFVGNASARDATGRRTVCVDELMREHGISHLHMLHSDIQGFEMDMLDGADESLKAGKVDYVFISTHSQALHEACRARLLARGFTILADADMQNTYSLDGLLAARRSDLVGAAPVAIALKARA